MTDQNGLNETQKSFIPIVSKLLRIAQNFDAEKIKWWLIVSLGANYCETQMIFRTSTVILVCGRTRDTEINKEMLIW